MKSEENMNNRINFTVETLIQVLQKLPPDMPVLTHGYKEHFDAVLEPVVRDVKYNVENEDFCGMYELCDEGEDGSIEALVLFRDGRWG
ncbi:MAG: hypothetical protein ACTSW1_15450 [Candidatus Hodarchaeales archaeon]